MGVGLPTLTGFQWVCYYSHRGGLHECEDHRPVTMKKELIVAKFLNSMFENFELGGQSAAQLLRTSIAEYVQGSLPDTTHDVEVLIRVNYNIRGLSKAYVWAGVLQNQEDLGRFAHCFIWSTC